MKPMNGEVQFDGAYFFELMTVRYGAKKQFEDAWHVDADVSDDTHLGVNTLARWISGQTPSRSNLLKIARLLDVDPLVLLAINEKNLPIITRGLRDYFVYQRSGYARSVLFLSEILSPSENWPQKTGSFELLGHKKWFAKDFEHQAKSKNRNYYKCLSLSSIDRIDRTLPQVWYFAWRRLIATPQEWRPYGAVKRIGNEVTLFHEIGFVDHRSTAPDANVFVETYFGAGPAEFRVCSLHPFGLELVERHDRDFAAVRFPA